MLNETFSVIFKHRAHSTYLNSTPGLARIHLEAKVNRDSGELSSQTAFGECAEAEDADAITERMAMTSMISS